MYLQVISAILAALFLKESASQTNPYYVGAQTSKAYFFPWMVTFHHELEWYLREFFGSGSIVTPHYVLASMDSFTRPARYVGAYFGMVFAQDIRHMYAYAGTVWGSTYANEENLRNWRYLQKLSVEYIYFFSSADYSSTSVLHRFEGRSQPHELNTFERSAHGLIAPLALVRVSTPVGGARDAGFIWKRGTLPIPLYRTTSADLNIWLMPEIDKLEISPFDSTCHIAGWRPWDRRLVRYEVDYVPIKQCQLMYCSYDSRNCLKFPVEYGDGSRMHVCFKSETFDDVCWWDQGSALFCPDIQESVIAILTSAPACGFRGLPAVFTLIPQAMKLFERATLGQSERYVPLSADDRENFKAPPESLLFTRKI